MISKKQKLSDENFTVIIEFDIPERCKHSR
jgi:hypothetical protein